MKFNVYWVLGFVWVLAFAAIASVASNDGSYGPVFYWKSVAGASITALIVAVVMFIFYNGSIVRLQNEVEQLKKEAHNRKMDYEWASACYLQMVVATGCPGLNLEVHHVRPGLRHLARQIQKIAEENIALQQGELAKGHRDTPGKEQEEEFGTMLDNRSKEARDAFWDVVNRLSHFDSTEEIDWVRKIRSWKEVV